MAPEIPSIPMDQIQTADILQTYWLLFQHMKNDFVHNSDLMNILTTNILAPGCVSVSGGPVTGTVLFPQVGATVGVEAVAASFQTLANTGAAFRQTTIASASTVTSGG